MNNTAESSPAKKIKIAINQLRKSIPSESQELNEPNLLLSQLEQIQSSAELRFTAVMFLALTAYLGTLSIITELSISTTHKPPDSAAEFLGNYIIKPILLSLPAALAFLLPGYKKASTIENNTINQQLESKRISLDTIISSSTPQDV